MAKRLVGLLALAAFVSGPALAQDDSGPVAEQKRKVRSVIVYGDDPCPEGANADEIVVCSRQPERERYRMPSGARKADTAPTQSWSARVRAMDAEGKTGIGSCSPVGAGGATGCTLEQMREAQAEKQQTETEAGAATAP